VFDFVAAEDVLPKVLTDCAGFASLNGCIIPALHPLTDPCQFDILPPDMAERGTMRRILKAARYGAFRRSGLRRL
jgi:hypothetical protein